MLKMLDGCTGLSLSCDRDTKGKKNCLSPPTPDVNVDNVAAELGGLKLYPW